MLFVNFTMPPLIVRPRAVSSPEPQPDTCALYWVMSCDSCETASHCRIVGRSVDRGNLFCHFMGKSVELCEDVQAARSRTAPRHERKSPTFAELLLDRSKHGAVSLNEERGPSLSLRLCSQWRPTLICCGHTDSRSSLGWSWVVFQNKRWHLTHITLD